MRFPDEAKARFIPIAGAWREIFALLTKMLRVEEDDENRDVHCTA